MWNPRKSNPSLRCTLLVAFIGYQLYRIALHPSLGLTALTIVDAIIVWLTWREYRKQRTARRHGRAVPTR
jgi:uncharacterized membrane protein